MEVDRLQAGETVFVPAWDEGGHVVEDLDTGYWVSGDTRSGYVSDLDLKARRTGGDRERCARA